MISRATLALFSVLHATGEKTAVSALPQPVLNDVIEPLPEPASAAESFPVPTREDEAALTMQKLAKHPWSYYMGDETTYQTPAGNFTFRDTRQAKMHAPLPPNCKDDGHPDAIEAQLGPLEFDRRNCSYLDGTWDERDLQIINYQGDNNVTFYVQRSSPPGPRIPEYDCDFGDEKPAPLRVTGIEYGTASAQCVEGEDDPAPGLTTGEEAGIGLGAVFTAGVLVIAGKKGYDKCQDQAAGAGPAAVASLVAVPLNPAEGS